MTTSLGQTVLYNVLTPVRVVATANLTGTYYNGPTNNGVGATFTISASSLTIDGVALAAGDRVLLTGQTSALQNGIYVVQSIASTVVLVRAFDQQSIEQLKRGQFSYVGAGSANAGSTYCLVDPLPQNIGVDSFIYTARDLVAATSITAAQFIAMSATPINLIPAPGSNKIIIVDRMELVLTYGTAQFTGGGVVAAQYGSTATGGGTKATNTEQATDFTGATASTVYQFIGASGNASQVTFANGVNVGIYLSNATAPFAAGDSTLVAKVHYHIITTA